MSKFIRIVAVAILILSGCQQDVILYQPSDNVSKIYYTTKNNVVLSSDTGVINFSDYDIIADLYDNKDGGILYISGTMYNINDSMFKFHEELTTIIIPDSVTTIGNSAFSWCESLTSVTIGNSVTTIGDSAFYNCSSLISVTIGDSVTTIGDGAFCSCGSLTSVTIPDSVTTIGGHAFSYCESLTSVTIPDSVTTIGDWAFAGCTSLTRVYCEATTPPSLGDDAFKYYVNGYVNIGCPIYVPAESVEAYKAASGWSDYAADIVGYDFGAGEEEEVSTNQLCYTATALVKPSNTSAFNVSIVSNEWDEATGEGIITFDGELTTIGKYAFEGCSSLTNVTIGDSVTTIGNGAFYSCGSLTSVTIPDSVTTIGDCAFSWCESLTSVTIPDSVTTIGEDAFEGCISLTSVTIGDSVTTIGDDAFYHCTSLTSVTIPDSVTTIGNGVFADCSNLAEFKGKFAADGGRCLIKDNTIIAYAEASGTTYTIPDRVTTIGDSAFRYCDSLTSVTIPDSVTTIGEGAFYYCDSLTSVTIPDSVTTIGDEAFWRCHSLTGVTIPDSVTTIGDHAFCYCISLTSVTIPDSVTTIGEGAFTDCTSLTSVYCEATTPPTLDYGAFYNNAQGRKIYLPAESVKAYKAADGWSDYADDIVGYDFETGEVVE